VYHYWQLAQDYMG